MTLADKKPWLFLSCKNAWTNSAAASCVEVAMTAAIFDQPVNLIFCGDGVTQLLKNQDASGLNQKSLAQLFPALELYDVKNIYVDAVALQERELNLQDLLLPVTLVQAAAMRSMITESHTVFIF
ncbi:MAG: DsrE family protein [Pseudohongiellaceae bacterium]|jgi:tRNA 2-thiouridine synthesizing protein C